MVEEIVDCREDMIGSQIMTSFWMKREKKVLVKIEIFR
jgi:hypothetical protein